MDLTTYEGIAEFCRRAVEETKRPNCDGSFDPHSKRDRRDTIRHNELIATACEKQTGKKPILSKYGLSCSECNTPIIDNYCHTCGQKVDFSIKVGKKINYKDELSSLKSEMDFVRGIVENVTHRNLSDVNSMNEYQAIQALSDFLNPRGEKNE